MSNMEDTVRRIVDENSQSRLRATQRMSRLTAVLTKGEPDEFQSVVRDILNEALTEIDPERGEGGDSGALGNPGTDNELGSVDSVDDSG